MIQAPYKEYLPVMRPARVSGTGMVGQYLSWPTVSNIVAYGNADPSAAPLGVYGTDTSGIPGSIGLVTAITQDSNGANWYTVDTTNGAVPASQDFIGYTSNIVYIPAFGDTTQSDYTQLTPAQISNAGSNTAFTSTNTSTGSGAGGTTPGGTGATSQQGSWGGGFLGGLFMNPFGGSGSGSPGGLGNGQGWGWVIVAVIGGAIILKET